MKAKEIRENFLRFFESKAHKIVPSAPMVVKNDPTLMFTNAGMNQFKDLFLGNSAIVHKRIADSQKCLRVSGKHNDLEEVGHDTYHHTMFEMLGNWSFGDYFKEEAIDWAWELLTNVYKIPVDRLYATVFEGSSAENISADLEAKNYWKKYLPEERIIFGSKKDNFWEMGDTGPCGPCSEVHVDIRTDEERAKISGLELVNKSHPHVIEIWNLVFIQYNRKADSSLELLPAKHVDTGMGFERLCMVIQGKQSNYDTDVFQPIIQKIAQMAGVKYGENEKADIAIRVISDHLRTVCFAITDGQRPDRKKAGYVIRRILRRAIRYGYTFLKFDEPFIYKLLPVLIESMGDAYPELIAQQSLVEKVIKEEESTFLRTLDKGIRLLDELIEKLQLSGIDTIAGTDVFRLYDTFGFPVDLTELIAREKNMKINKEEFDKEIEKQKSLSRDDSAIEASDWVVMQNEESEFIGYDFDEATVHIIKYRKQEIKGKTQYQLVFDITPFYGESGGQVGDTGYLEADGKRIEIVDTKKENNLIVHITAELPENVNTPLKAVVNDSRKLTKCNHSATHLLHEALRSVLGNHVEQKGSFVNAERLRFDFSHFQKMTDEEIEKVETIVNENIRKNFILNENRHSTMEEAQKMGAMALFGEKYGDNVRVIQFGTSVELCGGTHVQATGQIGLLKVVSESAIAAGIRRIEAITSKEADNYVKSQISTVKELKQILKNPKDVLKSVENLLNENSSLQKQIEKLLREKAEQLRNILATKAIEKNGMKIIIEKVELESSEMLKDLAFQLKNSVENLFLVLGVVIEGKPSLTVMISENLVKEKNLNAGNIIREIAKEIQGGGGGQAYYATAGGKNPDGIDNALNAAKRIIE